MSTCQVKMPQFTSFVGMRVQLKSTSTDCSLSQRTGSNSLVESGCVHRKVGMRCSLLVPSSPNEMITNFALLHDGHEKSKLHAGHRTGANMSYSIADHLSGWGLDITMQLLCRERLAIDTLLTHCQPVIIIAFCNYLFKIEPDRGHFSCKLWIPSLTSLFPQDSDITIASWCSNSYPQIPCGIGNA